MTDKNQEDDIAQLSFEEAIAALTEIVEKVEQGQMPLQDSLDQYERGMALIKHCRTILQEAEQRIERITQEEEKKED
ncbi:MAG: exodeoxyribonuclease VII small subunit [Planctomycetota bacterium]|jgi:exodeoxyribonuclease VII small subunit